MKISILNEKNNSLMKRKEIVIEIEHDREKTPSRAEVHGLLSKQLSAEPDKIEILDIFSGHGITKSRARIDIWHDKIPEPKVKKKKEIKKEKKKEVSKKS